MHSLSRCLRHTSACILVVLPMHMCRPLFLLSMQVHELFPCLHVYNSPPLPVEVAAISVTACSCEFSAAAASQIPCIPHAAGQRVATAVPTQCSAAVGWLSMYGDVSSVFLAGRLADRHVTVHACMLAHVLGLSHLPTHQKLASTTQTQNSTRPVSAASKGPLLFCQQVRHRCFSRPARSTNARTASSSCCCLSLYQ